MHDVNDVNVLEVCMRRLKGVHTDVSFLEACMILLHGVRNVSVL